MLFVFSVLVPPRAPCQYSPNNELWAHRVLARNNGFISRFRILDLLSSYFDYHLQRLISVIIWMIDNITKSNITFNRFALLFAFVPYYSFHFHCSTSEEEACAFLSIYISNIIFFYFVFFFFSLLLYVRQLVCLSLSLMCVPLECRKLTMVDNLCTCSSQCI